MIRRPAALLAASAALLAAAVATPTAAADPADPAPLLLRLPDLGPGYVISQVGFSTVNRSCKPQRPSDRFLRRALGSAAFRGCWLSFEQAWTPRGHPPGPAGVQSLVFTFDTPAAATTALSRPRELPVPYLRRRDLHIVEPVPSIGDQAVLMRVSKSALDLSFSAGIVAWRSGSVLGIVVAASLTRGSASVQAAVRLAALQQARIASPTPLLPPVNDDRFVPLDDPTLSVPVMWSGERLPAHSRFPELDLRATEHPFNLFGGPQALVQMAYGVPHHSATVKVELWRPRALRRNLRAPLRRDLCQRRFDGGLPNGHATIRATYRRRHGRCQPRDARFTAVAFFVDVGVWIGASGRPGDPYNSRAGLRRLLRALHPRERVPLTAP